MTEDLAVGPSSRLSILYSSSGDLRYDEARLRELRNQLLQSLEDLPIEKLQNVSKDFEALRARIRARSPGAAFDKAFKKAAVKWVSLFPLLYDADGKAIDSEVPLGFRQAIRRKIERLDAPQLSNLYRDLFLKEQSRTILDEIKPVVPYFNSAKNTFVDKVVIPALSPVGNVGAAQQRSMSLELVPAAARQYRGCFGGDCSIKSVPYYGLIRGTKTYWIRKGTEFDSQPIGYAFVVPVKTQSGDLPYVLTINGSTLTESDTRAALRLIAEDWRASELVLPDFKETKFLINYAPIKRGMTFEESVRHEAKLTPGWTIVEDYQKRNKIRGYDNYYSSDKIKNARRVSVNQLPQARIKVHLPEVAYRPISDLTKIPLLERALLAAGTFDGDSSQQVSDQLRAHLAYLQVTPEQFQAAGILRTRGPYTPLTLADYRMLQEQLDFKISDLMKLSPVDRAVSLNQLYASDPGLATPERWNALFMKTDEQLLEELEAATPRPFSETEKYFHIFELRARFPHQYTQESVWDELVSLTRHEQAHIASYAKETLDKLIFRHSDAMSSAAWERLLPYSLKLTTDHPYWATEMVSRLGKMDRERSEKTAFRWAEYLGEQGGETADAKSVREAASMLSQWSVGRSWQDEIQESLLGLPERASKESGCLSLRLSILRAAEGN